MSRLEETNVRLPECAFDALAAVARRRGISRDETVRQLLGEHVERQEQLEADGRLTHISTVLRYPPPPQWRGAPRADRPLRLRVAPGLISRARAVSLRLPGQSQRAYRDYQGRLLTDAVMTAIAVEEPFADEFLHGLMPLIRQRSALGLWKLTIAATSTVPEAEIHSAAETERWAPESPLSAEESAARRRLLLVAETLEKEVAWHAPVRFQVAASIARDLLGGARADVAERMLYEQSPGRWGRLREELFDGGSVRDRYQGMITIYDCLGEICIDDTCIGHSSVGYDWTGRGGTAVWRAERSVEMQDFSDWLIERCEADPPEREVWPPGWLVRVPGTWQAHAVTSSPAEIPEPYATWVADGQLLAFPYQEGQAVWPVCPSHDPPEWAPVPGIEPLIGAAQSLRPDQIVGFIEAVLIDWGSTGSSRAPGCNRCKYEDSAVHIELGFPLDKARGFGFITPQEERLARAKCRAETLQAMDAVIGMLPEKKLYLRPHLEQAKGNARLFGRIVKKELKFITFEITRAAWLWPGGAVVDEVLAGTSADLVEWLAAWAHRTSSLLLEKAMEEAWRHTFDHYGRRV